MKPHFFVATLLGLCLSRAVLAEPLFASETLSLNGFGTLGGVYNLDGGADFIRDISQPDGARGDGVAWAVDSRLGLQATWRPLEDFESTLQLVSKYRHDGSYHPEITWAFLKYMVTPNVQIRAGRLGTDIYLQADSRDIGYGYLWVRPPVDYFGRLSVSYFDGADFAVTQELGEGILKGKLYAGQARETLPADGGAQYSLDGTSVAGGHIEYQNLNWLFRVSYAAIRLENETPAEPLLNVLQSTGIPQAVALAQEMSLARKRSDFFGAGIAYENGPLQSQLAISYLASDSLMFPDSNSGYWSIGYRIGQWTPYLVYSRIKSDHNQRATGLPNIPPFDAINAGVAQALSGSRADQETFTLGMRYDFARNVDFKLQLDWVDSRVNPSLLWRNPDPDWDGQATIISATLDFVF
ncbi:MAG TPA: hypothetical protein PKY50_19385 [Candidatus Competibacter sp.]|nr:hypothetical protein [Candidatus Competibacter sp.]